MLTFENDGSITIDFPNGPVRVKPPTFGGFKRLRAARVKLAREAQDRLTAWEKAHPVPDEGDDEQMDPTGVTRRAEDRIIEAEEANYAATEAWWRLVLAGDESFKGLAEGPIPENTDDWPPSLLVDFRPIIPPNSSVEVILSSQSMPDQVFRHWGKGQSNYSVGSNGMQPTSQSSPVP